MSYNPSIPNVGDFLSISQKQILANFQAINKSFFQDHVGLTSDNNVGKHKSLTFVPQAIDPPTLAGQAALYNKVVGSTVQLFFRSSSNTTPIQLSNSNLNTVQTGASVDTQSSFLAGPFTIYLGTVENCPNNNIITVTPTSTLIYVGLSMKLLVRNQGGATQIFNVPVPKNIAGDQFTINYSATVLNPPNQTKFPTVYYMAIGI